MALISVEPPADWPEGFFLFVKPDYKHFLWRVCQEDENLVWGVVSAHLPATDTLMFELGVIRADSAGQEPYAWRMTYVIDGAFCATWGFASRRSAERRGPLVAVGCALDARVTRIVGVTKGGVKAESVPVNGFWFLEADTELTDIEWESIKAYTSWGFPVHDYVFARNRFFHPGYRPPDTCPT